jgi:ribonuclease-3
MSNSAKRTTDPPSIPNSASLDHESDILGRCQEVIGYTFKNIELLRSALTHSSCANTRTGSNERMEFLGDSVLGLIVASYIYDRYPQHQEGGLTKIKSTVVSRTTCERLSRKLELGRFLFIGKGVGSETLTATILADVFEALIGAIYLDGGLEPARAFVLKHIEAEIQQAVAGGLNNAKSVLQQVTQKRFAQTPRYMLLDEQGPEHNKCFKVAVEFDKKVYPAAWGRTKRQAETYAAQNALAVLNGEPPPHQAME